MTRVIRLGLAAAVVAALLAPMAPAEAEIYRWVDDKGVPHYTDGLHGVPEEHRSQAVPLKFRSRPAPAPQASGTPGPGGKTEGAVPEGGTVVRYTPGQRIMVDVRINGGGSARLLLDTGADRTLISPRALAAAGVSITRPIARGQVASVTGTDQVDYVVLDSLEVGDARVSRLPVMAYEMPQAEGDGLLGRDFLDQFNVSIDGSRGQVTLSPKQ